VRYVALGDSFTIGTSVRPEERWPNQLAAALDAERAPERGGIEAVVGRGGGRGDEGRASGGPSSERPRLDLIANLAVNGSTSQDVIAAELPVLERLDPEFVSLLVGTNDVIQGVPPERYRANLLRILEDVEARVGAAHILGVTSPDYTVTRAGANYGDPTLRARQLRDYNAIFTDVLGELEIDLVDIHDISLRAATDRSLVADDELHPSGRQYALWVERILPSVRAIVAEAAPD
jgi:acyl-CoA thioesterase I